MPESYAYHEQRYGPRDRSLRACDHDREAIADVLREQHLAGRLDSEEFQERLDQCYDAKTYGELDELIVDLPRPAPTRRAPRAWRWPVAAFVPLLVAAIVLSHGHLLWLAIPLFFFVGRPLLWRFGGRRGGWGFAGCGIRQSPPPGSYL